MKVCETRWMKLEAYPGADNAPCICGLMAEVDNDEDYAAWADGEVKIVVYDRPAIDRFRVVVFICRCTSCLCYKQSILVFKGRDRYDVSCLPFGLQRFAKSLKIKGKQRRTFYFEVWFRK